MRRLLGARLALCPLVALCLLVGPGATLAWDWELTGALRGLGSANAAARIDGATAEATGLGEAGWMAAGVLRGIVVGRGEATKVELNVFADGSRSQVGLGDALGTVGGRRSRFRSAWLEAEPWREDPLTTNVGLDRLVIRHRVGKWSLALGRMPLTLSVTSLFTPNDLFAPFSAAAINRVYKPGVDALQVERALGMMSSVSLIAVGGFDDKGAPEGGSVLLRGTTLLGSFQSNALVGWHIGGLLVGVGTQGDVGPVNLRAEGHVWLAEAWLSGEADGKGDAWRSSWAVGVDSRLPWRNGAVSAEVLVVLDGAAEPGAYLGRAAQLRSDDLPYLGRTYAALSGGFEILPIVRVGVFALANVEDLSGLGGLSLMWNVADEIDVALGGFLPWGEPARVTPVSGSGAGLGGFGSLLDLGSEFGTAGPVAYLEGRWYF